MANGAIKHLHVVGRALTDESGSLEFVGAVTDITERHNARAALEKAVEEIKTLKDQLYKENLVLKEEIDRSSMFEEIVGASPALQAVLSFVSKVAPTDSTVLITGETGTGKELIARAVRKEPLGAGICERELRCHSAIVVGLRIVRARKGSIHRSAAATPRPL